MTLAWNYSEAAYFTKVSKVVVLRRSNLDLFCFYIWHFDASKRVWLLTFLFLVCQSRKLKLNNIALDCTLNLMLVKRVPLEFDLFHGWVIGFHVHHRYLKLILFDVPDYYPYLLLVVFQFHHNILRIQTIWPELHVESTQLALQINSHMGQTRKFYTFFIDVRFCTLWSFGFIFQSLNIPEFLRQGSFEEQEDSMPLLFNVLAFVDLESLYHVPHCMNVKIKVC